MTSTHRPRRRWLALVAPLVLLLGAMAGPTLAARPSASRLLPETTVAMVSIADFPETIQRYKDTWVGRMGQDAGLRPLVDRVYAGLVETMAAAQDRIGLSLPELLALPQGEVTLALVAPESAPLAGVLLLDVGDQLAGARRLLESLDAELARQGGSRREETVAGTTFVIYAGVGPEGRAVIYFVKEGTVVVGSDPEVVGGLLNVWNGGKGKTLAGDADFAAVMARCRTVGDERPQMIGYVDPIAIIRHFSQDNIALALAVNLFPTLGIDGLKALGGSVSLATEQFDVVTHGHVLLGAPRAGVTKMIALEPGDSTPERWVPADVASYSTFHWNVEQTYKEAAALYDQFNGEGALSERLREGVFRPTAIDLENELLPALDGRVTHITWVQRPVSLRGAVSLWALKLKDTRVFDRAIVNIASRFGETIARQTWGGKEFYQVQSMLPDDFPEEQRPPQPCFGVLDGYLMIADSASLYQTVVSTLVEGSDSLADDPEFGLVASKIRRQSGGQDAALLSFNRPEETVRWLYDLANSEATRERLAELAPQNPLLAALDEALRENKLPPFAVLRSYLAPGGGMVFDDETGLHYMGFTLRRQ